MNIVPIFQFVDDPQGTRWAVLFAGPHMPELLPGMKRHLVFRAEDHQYIVAYDWIAIPPTAAALNILLAEARRADA